MRSGIKVFAPASISNIACGFDLMGIALEQPGDEIVATLSDKPGLRFSAITGAKGKLPLDPTRNTAGVAAQALLDHLGESQLGVEFELRKKMPFGSGLGSSAASAVAGAMAINELLKRPLEKRDLLPFAMQGEQLASKAWHADNVAPSLIGGIVFIRDNASLDVHRLPAPNGLHVTVVFPHIEILTSEARAILSPQVSLKQHTEQSGNLGGLIIGIYRQDLDLMARSLKDVIIEGQRAQLIPHFHAAQAAALAAGAMGCSISGSGPSIFALSANSLIAERVGEAFEKIYADAKIGHTLYISPINHEGAQKL